MYYIYKVTNKITRQFYIGVHKTENPDDGYYGSGIRIKRAVRKYGKDGFTKEILYGFVNRNDAYSKEKELLELVLDNELCYNLKEGGIGGWEYVNKHCVKDNPMHNPEYVAKNKASYLKNLTPERIEKRKQIRSVNIRKAIAYNTGRKRPEHGDKVREHSIRQWRVNREGMRDKLASYFDVTSPDGTVTRTNRLQELCESLGLPYVTVWKTSKTYKPITKGKAKGWKCRLITQNCPTESCLS